MSSNNTKTKAKKVISKAVAKSAAKAAPAKKVAKPAEKKAVSKPVPKTTVKKAAVKTVVKPSVKKGGAAKKGVAAKPSRSAVKAVVKNVAKVAVKSSAKAQAKPVAKKSVAPATKSKVVSKATKPVKSVSTGAVRKTEIKAAQKKATRESAQKAVAKAVAQKAIAKSTAKPTVSKPAVKLVVQAESSEGKIITKQAVKPVVAPTKSAVAKTVADTAPIEKKEPVKEKDLTTDDVVLLAGAKKVLKTPFFSEVDDAEERANKKKYSAETKGPEKPTASSRRKSSLVEETPEELIERLAMELEEENFGIMREAEMQLCTKCGINSVSPEFRVDKDLGYCDECAEILHLGQTKEARKVDYQMSLMRKDAAGPSSDSDEDADDIEIDDEDVEDLDEED